MSNEHKYQVVIDWIKQQIAQGVFHKGDRLLPEHELADKFGLSRQTVRKATGDLVSEGILVRVQGSGTYIGSTVSPRKRRVYGRIVIISTYVDSYIFPPTLKGIQDVLNGAGYMTQTSFTGDSVWQERNILTHLIADDNFDGIIVEAAKSGLPNPNADLYRKLQTMNVPIICFNASYPQLGLPCVRIDDFEVGRDAARMLIEAGHEHIGLIMKSDDGQSHLRYAGYMNALLEKNIQAQSRHTVMVDTETFGNMSAIGGYILERLKGTTACLCYNDDAAWQLISILKDAGIRVPEDYSVVGIDDAESASPHAQTLTSFSHPKEELGRRTAENLLEMIENPGFDGNYIFRAESRVRESVAAPGRGIE
ncbi:MAG: GntR family transcriptional regulator [Lachnospiraceae bacterium]|nr:GntR family transcriptional regulator [Lachnospiraceae bacterium]